jgi:hypothetical protein
MALVSDLHCVMTEFFGAMMDNCYMEALSDVWVLLTGNTASRDENN